MRILITNGQNTIAQAGVILGAGTPVKWVGPGCINRVAILERVSEGPTDRIRCGL
ncbi:hypothetical protein D3C86_1861610 [compost metagenome]